MGKCEPYPEEFKRDLVKRYLQSGLNRYQFCHLPDVTVSEISIRRWLRELEAEASEGGSPGDLNIACYTIGPAGGTQAVPAARRQERGPSLAEMVAFHADVQGERKTRVIDNEAKPHLLEKREGECQCFH